MKAILLASIAVLAIGFGTFAIRNFPGTSAIPTVATEVTTPEPAQVIAGVFSSATKTITWQTKNYPAGAGIDANLIRKVSSAPASYTFVRKILNNTANDGSEIWAPAANETGNDLFIEITCSA